MKSLYTLNSLGRLRLIHMMLIGTYLMYVHMYVRPTVHLYLKLNELNELCMMVYHMAQSKVTRLGSTKFFHLQSLSPLTFTNGAGK